RKGLSLVSHLMTPLRVLASVGRMGLGDAVFIGFHIPAHPMPTARPLHLTLLAPRPCISKLITFPYVIDQTCVACKLLSEGRRADGESFFFLQGHTAFYGGRG